MKLSVRILNLAVAVTVAASCLAQSKPSDPAVGPVTEPVRITHGPVVELVSDSSAQLAWSTNVNAGTVVHYGTDPANLTQIASMPWGGLTHRVILRHLTPETTYYFKVESPQGQDTGSRAEAPEKSLKTLVQGQPPVRNPGPR
jgi:Purple acid Phosphatase, N-terminal domain